MYIIVVYDIDASRVSKVNKLLKRYIVWVQNSVFEGEIGEKLLDDMIKRLKRIIKDSDSVIIYTFRAKSYTDRLLLGEEKGSISNVI